MEIQKITADVVCRLFFGKDFTQVQVDGLDIPLALLDSMNDTIK